MNIIDEIKEREKMYKKGKSDAISNESAITKWGDVRRNSFLYKTYVSIDYFKDFMAKKFPDLELVRIVSITTDYIPMYQDAIWNNKYKVEYAMMSKQSIEMLMEKEKGLVFKDDKSYIMVCQYSCYTKKNSKRDELLTMCPIIILYSCCYGDEGRIREINKYLLKEVTDATFPEKISLYPEGTYDSDKKDRTRFLLYANNPVISQKSLDNICMAMLRELNKEADKEISKEIFIYENIRKKLLEGSVLNNDEWEVVLEFLNNEEDKIKNKHTLLKRSLIKMEGKK